jgi:hypothetical protein
MATLDEHFERELEIFRTEAEACAQFLFAFLAVHDVAYRKKAVHKLLNRAPLFWNTCLGALQASAFIALGRVFDSNSPHNINKLLKIAQDNRTQLFSKAALGRRKQGSKLQPPEWLRDFLRSAHEPSVDDFRRIKKRVAKWRRTYEANYRDVRHQVFAHKEVTEEHEITALFSKGTSRELQQLIASPGHAVRSALAAVYEWEKARTQACALFRSWYTSKAQAEVLQQSRRPGGHYARGSGVSDLCSGSAIAARRRLRSHSYCS